LLGGFGGQVVNDAKAFKQLSDAMIDTNYPTVAGSRTNGKIYGSYTRSNHFKIMQELSQLKLKN
jgi:hypothetical protein